MSISFFQRWIFSLCLPALIWLIALFLRPSTMQLRCKNEPTSCNPSSIFWLDRFSLSLNNSKADEISFLAQNLTGIISFSILLIWGTIAVRNSQPHLKKTAIIQSLRNSWIWIQVVLWNGFFTEIARLALQRPRPFVYSDPRVLGANPAHYTSFYSGHTSFATASGVISILLFSNYSPPKWIRDPYVALVGALIMTTAICRILSGRHFLTDVLAAIVAGSIVAIFFYRYHRLNIH